MQITTKRLLTSFLTFLCLSLHCSGNAQEKKTLTYNAKKVPSYLKAYKKEYKKDPHLAALKWFSEAKYGLFMHYGVYSQVGRGEWVMFGDKIHVNEYTKLKDSFDPSGFDANAITDMALDAGMKYICITTKHHDSFCLWDTKETDFKSTNAKGHRDLVKELATQCHKKGIALFLYYSYGRDWRHPHGVYKDSKGEVMSPARPHYTEIEEHYAKEPEYKLDNYVNYVNNQVTELLTNYGPIAAIWFDAPPEAEANFETFKPYKTYDLIHQLQPQCLVSAKWGIEDPTGKHSMKEDFFAPEINQYKASMQSGGKPIEVCMTFNGSWGWKGTYKNKGIDFLKNAMKASNYLNANLLMNIAPLPDGSIHANDQKSFREVGDWLQKNGWPKERMHPKDAHIHWKEGKEAYPGNAPYQPLKLDFKKSKE